MGRIEETRSIQCEGQGDGMMTCQFAHGNDYSTMEFGDIDYIALNDADTASWRSGRTRMDGGDQLSFHPDSPANCRIQEKEGPGRAVYC